MRRRRGGWIPEPFGLLHAWIVRADTNLSAAVMGSIGDYWPTVIFTRRWGVYFIASGGPMFHRPESSVCRFNTAPWGLRWPMDQISGAPFRPLRKGCRWNRAVCFDAEHAASVVKGPGRGSIAAVADGEDRRIIQCRTASSQNGFSTLSDYFAGIKRALINQGCSPLKSSLGDSCSSGAIPSGFE